MSALVSTTEYDESIAGYPKFRMNHGSGKSSAEIFLNGATVVSWKVAGQENLFVSPKAVYAVGKAIRGGIPIVFRQHTPCTPCARVPLCASLPTSPPSHCSLRAAQFGPGKLPQHGFARNKLVYARHTPPPIPSTSPPHPPVLTFLSPPSPSFLLCRVQWAHGETTVNKATGDVSTTFTLRDDAETRAVWPHAFLLTLTVVLKATSLSHQLSILNSGDAPFTFTTLLHSYFRVDNLSTTRVRGLQGLTYLDKPNDARPTTDADAEVAFRGEVDRVYLGGGGREVRIGDEGNAEWLLKVKGFKDFVVWNPAPEKAGGMADLGEEVWDRFICVEAGSVAEPVQLGKGEVWEGAQGVSIVMRENAQK